MEGNLAAPDQAPAKAKGYEDGLSVEMLVEMVDEAEEATEESRRLSETCRKYYHNKQLSAEEKATLKARGQPEIMENVIRRKIKFLKGWERQSRSDPRAFPRNSPDDEEAGEAASDALRFQEQSQFLDMKFSACFEDMLLNGFTGVEVLGPAEHDPRIIEVKLWRWDRLGYDPYSAEQDFSDARYVYGVTWMDKGEAVKRWPAAKAVIEKTVADEISRQRTYDDKPNKFAWGARTKRERVKIVQMYYRSGAGATDWKWCLFTRAGKIESGAVELQDQFGRPECPMILHSAYVDEDNGRYGEVVELLTMQDAINKSHSKLQHLMSTRQTIAEQGAILDPDEFKKQSVRPDGHMTVAPGALVDKRFQVLENSADIASHAGRLDSLRQSFSMMGPNSALQGKQEQAASGRAIRASQEGGLIELTDLKDEHTHFKRRVYRALWNRIRQFWTEETWVRVTDNDENVRFVGFNRPETVEEQMVKDARKEGIPDEEIFGRLEKAKQDPMMAQELSQVVGQANVPAEIDVDIIVDVSTETINMQEETFLAMSNMFPPGSLPPEVILELAPISPKKKRQIKEMLKPPPPDPAMVQKQEAIEGMQADNLQADTDAKRAKAMKDEAAAGKSVVETLAPPMPVDTQDQQIFGL